MEDLVLSCLESRVEENRNLYARFLLGPFVKGQALTVATALRRSLLSSVESIGITALSIQGITHEFSTIAGVRESVLELSLNFQKVVLCYQKDASAPKKFSEGVHVGYLQVQGPKIVYANDLKLPLGIGCVDPTQYIATLSIKGLLVVKFLIGKSNSTVDLTHYNRHKSTHEALQSFVYKIGTHGKWGRSPCLAKQTGVPVGQPMPSGQEGANNKCVPDQAQDIQGKGTRQRYLLPACFSPFRGHNKALLCSNQSHHVVATKQSFVMAPEGAKACRPLCHAMPFLPPLPCHMLLLGPKGSASQGKEIRRGKRARNGMAQCFPPLPCPSPKALVTRRVTMKGARRGMFMPCTDFVQKQNRSLLMHKQQLQQKGTCLHNQYGVVCLQYTRQRRCLVRATKRSFVSHHQHKTLKHYIKYARTLTRDASTGVPVGHTCPLVGCDVLYNKLPKYEPLEKYSVLKKNVAFDIFKAQNILKAKKISHTSFASTTARFFSKALAFSKKQSVSFRHCGEATCACRLVNKAKLCSRALPCMHLCGYMATKLRFVGGAKATPPIGTGGLPLRGMGYAPTRVDGGYVHLGCDWWRSHHVATTNCLPLRGMGYASTSTTSLTTQLLGRSPYPFGANYKCKYVPERQKGVCFACGAPKGQEGAWHGHKPQHLQNSVLQVPLPRTKKAEFFKSDLSFRHIIPLDFSLTPINQVNFTIETDNEVIHLYDQVRERIILEVWTNGSVQPRQAVHEAVLSLIESFSALRATMNLNQLIKL